MNDQALFDYALIALARGFAVFPCWPQTKKPATRDGFYSATCDTAKVEAWWQENPNYNPAIACEASKITVIDGDYGFHSWEQAEAWREKNGLPATYAVRTGRRPEFGLQLYYRGQTHGSDWELDGASGEIKSEGGYVIAAGSIHPDSGEQYVVVADLPLAPLPEDFLNKARKSKAKQTHDVKPGEKVPAGQRQAFLVSKAGHLWNAGLKDEAFIRALDDVNKEFCNPPKDRKFLEGILKSAERGFEEKLTIVPADATAQIDAWLNDPAAVMSSDEVIATLALCRPLDSEQRSKKIAKRLGVTVAVLRQEVKQAHKQAAEKQRAPQQESDHAQTAAEVLAEFNENFFVIENVGNRCRVGWLKPEAHPDLGDRLVLGCTYFDDFRSRYSHIQIKVGEDKLGKPMFRDKGSFWIDHPDRRQYENVVFAPGRELGPRVLNLWRGFAFEPKAGDCSLYLAHLNTIICKDNPILYDYLIRWFAYGVQHPGEPGHTALVFRGNKGTGKSIAAEEYGSLWGEHFLPVTNASHIVGNFNVHLRDTSVLLVNEAFYAGNKQHEAVLKGLVTDPTLPIEQKFVDLITARNLLHIIITSNSSWVIPASDDERRFVVFDVSDERRGDLPYFRAIVKERENGGYAALLDYLLNFDLSRFDPRAIPKTSGLRSQMAHSLTGFEDVWYEVLYRGEIPGTRQKNGDIHVRTTALLEWAAKTNDRWKGIKAAQVGYLLGGDPRKHEGHRGMGFAKTRDKIQRSFDEPQELIQARVWIIPPLPEARKRWDEKRFEVEWDTTGCEIWETIEIED